MAFAQKIIHMNMTQDNVFLVQVDATVSIKCKPLLSRGRKQPTTYQVFWIVCLCQTVFCFFLFAFYAPWRTASASEVNNSF